MKIPFTESAKITTVSRFAMQYALLHRSHSTETDKHPSTSYLALSAVLALATVISNDCKLMHGCLDKPYGAVEYPSMPRLEYAWFEIRT